jgi:hypothetical protein
MTLASPSKRSHERWFRLSTGPPLMSFAGSPPPTSPVASTPGSKLPSARRRQAPDTFRPRGFSPPRRLSPLRGRGFVAPRCQPGVRRVASTPEPVPPEDGGGLPSAFPATRFTPFEELPSPTADIASLRAVAFLPLPATSDSSPRPKPRFTHQSRPEPGAAGPPRRFAGTGHLLDPVKLRSAEADPHVTEARAVPTGAGACASTNRLADDAEAPTGWDGQIPSWVATQPDARESRHRGAAPGGAVASRPSAEAADWSARDRSAEARRSDLSRRRERPTSRPCSADESVVSLRRCQRRDTRSFHGLCSPPRSLSLRTSPSMPCPGGAQRTRGPRRPRRTTGVYAGARRWNPSGDCPPPPPPKRCVRGTPRRAEARPERRAFSARRPKPMVRAPPPRCGRSRLRERSSAAGVCPEDRS